ncbi:hypothetical protein BDP55DRAFT_627708 [Colletotrichum godetiae]|uniref:Uncharacterized protein n=1 Tax=Colletotrichum godetiae TaxID=1209918 RepID=A0AAJ0AXW9_9PEZI|nr:uncharacterized protein BDP55DRAFT_627708 [Colletotrichum godetiae]KAK1691036.1 hypothetical protein BDP55DRAFT_627708 [Colletotrichum godetiae]
MPLRTERSRSEAPSSSASRTLPGSRRLRRRAGNFSLRVSIRAIPLVAASSAECRGTSEYSESFAANGTDIRLPDMECYLGQGSMTIECEVDGPFVITPRRPTDTSHSAISSDAGSLVPALISRPNHYPSNRSSFSAPESSRGRRQFAESPILGGGASHRQFEFHGEPSLPLLRSRRVEMFYRDSVAPVPLMPVFSEVSSVSSSSQRLPSSPINPPPQYSELVHLAGNGSWTSSLEEQQALEAAADDLSDIWDYST